MPKARVQSISCADAMADILDLVENLQGEEYFELETNKIPDEINRPVEIEDSESEPEEGTDEPHPRRDKKKPTKSRLFHSTDSALDPSNYDYISSLNNHGHWETLLDYLRPKSNKVTKRFCG